MKNIFILLLACISFSCKSSDSTTNTQDVKKEPVPSSLKLFSTGGYVGTAGKYRVENNVWGKGSITDWLQAIGLDVKSNGNAVARWIWNWQFNGTENVKAYPEIIFGQKPGTTTTTSALPKKISDIQKFTMTYDIISTRSGSGNLAFDVWLTNTNNPVTFAAPPITHEIMIWLDSFGGMQAGGTFIENATIDSVSYKVYKGENFGDGWRYIALVRTAPKIIDTLNFSAILKYIQSKTWITGNEFISSIELGNEIVYGSGDTSVNDFNATVE